MSVFKPLQLKRPFTSTPAAPTSSFLRPSRPFASLSTPASEAVSHVLQTQVERTASFAHSLAHIPIDAPEKNNTGLPDKLKTGIESLSGISLDDVHVHYNSSKPAQVQALAYTQGTEIYIGPGQERHLPHETWHVVQQKQGRVNATMQVQGMALNNSLELEHEADVMPTRPVQGGKRQSIVRQSSFSSRNIPIQRLRDLKKEQRVKVHTGGKKDDKPIISGKIIEVKNSYYKVNRDDIDKDYNQGAWFLEHAVYPEEMTDEDIHVVNESQIRNAMAERPLREDIASGPAPGVLEVSNLKRSTEAFRRYTPSGRHSLRGHRGARGKERIKDIEFVFDPLAQRFAVGRHKRGLPGATSPHQHLARLINANEEVVVGGHFKRGENGEIMLNENSGHYGRQWTTEVRKQIKEFLENRTNQKVIHEIWEDE